MVFLDIFFLRKSADNIKLDGIAIETFAERVQTRLFQLYDPVDLENRSSLPKSNHLLRCSI